MKGFLVICAVFSSVIVHAQDFTLIPIGVRGGVDEANLSAYLIGSGSNENYLSLDAGTVFSGVQNYLKKENKTEEPSRFVKDKIKGYFISHPHFDHSSGLIINSPEDSPKYLYGSKNTLDAFKNHVFRWDVWGNFTNEGDKPALGKYTYENLEFGTWFEVKNTDLKAKIFPLSHVGENLSSAILLKNSKDAYFLYLGDTGTDRIEKSNQLKNLWKVIAPLIQENKLRAIALECSYANDQPDDKLFGHLKPKLLQEELLVLQNFTGKKALQKVKLIITHIKPKAGIIEKLNFELQPLNDMISWEIAEQGRKITFSK